MTQTPAPNNLREVADAADLKKAGMLAVEIDGQAIVLISGDGGKAYAVEGKCPHAGAPLIKGRLCDGQLICPWHTATFRIYDGAWLQPPALRGLKTFTTHVRDGKIWLDPTPRPSGHEFLYAGEGPHTVAVIGAGAAGAAACTALRDCGYDRAILLIDPKPEEPIDRTMLSKGALSGKVPLEKLPLWNAEKFEKLRITRIVAAVKEFNAEHRFLVTSENDRIAFDAAVIATGGTPKKPSWPGGSLAGVHVLRDRSDLQSLLADLRPQARVFIAGASFIGMEAASALREAGMTVTVAGRENVPFQKKFGAEVGRAILKLHESKDVEYLPQTEVLSAHGASRVEAVTLANGQQVACDVVLVGYGVDLALDAFSGLRKAENGGLLVDHLLRAAPDVYAAGDIAAVQREDGAPVRIEHWRVAEQHGIAIAKSILGKTQPISSPPFFWSQQHGKRLTYIGHASKWDVIQVAGNLDTLECVVWYLKGDRVAAVFACGNEYATATLSDALARPLTLTEARELVKQPPL